MIKTTKIGYCKSCGKPFEKIGKGSGSRKYCESCAKENKRKCQNKYENKRPNRNEYKAKMQRKYRKEGRVKKRDWRKRDQIKQAEYQCNYYQNNPDKYDILGARWAFSNAIKKLNGWYGYELHHMIPVALMPEFAFEEWNLIPISKKLHKELHTKTGGFRNANNFNIDWIKELMEVLSNDIC